MEVMKNIGRVWSRRLKELINLFWGFLHVHGDWLDWSNLNIKSLVLELDWCSRSRGAPSGKPRAPEIFNLSRSLSLSGEEQVGEGACERAYGYFVSERLSMKNKWEKPMGISVGCLCLAKSKRRNGLWADNTSMGILVISRSEVFDWCWKPLN